MATAPQAIAIPTATAERPGGVTVRAVAVSLVLLFLINVAVSRLELVVGRYIASGIPPIPVVLILSLLTASAPLGQKLLRRQALSRQEILTIYCLLLISVPFCGTYGVRSFLPRLTVMQYYAMPENRFADYVHHLPSWYAPDSMQVIQDMYEGSDQPVPWHAWLGPLSAWTLFFLFLFLTALSLMNIFWKQWSQAERLPYPLVQLPMEMAGSPRSQGVLRNFFANPLTWIGIFLAFVYNALSIAHAFNPAIPYIEQSKSLDDLLTEEPWTALRPLVLNTYPGSIGFGYLVSQELCASVVVFTFATKFLGVGAHMVGYEPPDFPYWQEQSAGGYVALALFMLYAARGHLRHVWRKVWDDTAVDDSQEAVPYRWSVIGLGAGALFFLGWCQASGMSLALAIPFFLLVMFFALTYARIRAEAGVPQDFVYPYRLPQYMIINALGPRTMLGMGGARSVVILEVMSFLSRFHPTQIMTAFQTDILEISHQGRLQRRRLAAAVTLVFIAGMVFAFWGHFTTFYSLGLNVLEGNPRNADWRTFDTVGAFKDMVTRIETPTGPNTARTAWTIGGGLFTLAMALARTVWLRFPLHPLGYVVALAYGPSTYLWFPFLLVFLIKWALLKVGGIGSYRRLIPLFIGLVVGHYLFGGVAWPIISLFHDSAISQRYYTVF